MATKKASAEVQKTLTGLDVDMVGVARLRDLKGTPLEASARKLLPSARLDRCRRHGGLPGVP